MSRSRKRSPVTGITAAESEKWDKRLANRLLRRHVRWALFRDPEADVLPHLREVSNVWAFAKDGKLFRPSWFRERDLRK